MHKLNIVLFGNINNYPLILAEGLMSLGHKVHLVVNRPEELHRPEAKYPDWRGAYPGWVVDGSFLTEEDVIYETAVLDRILYHITTDVDLVIVNDIGPALAGRLRCPHVALLTGSDIFYYANFDSITRRTCTWDSDFRRSPEGRRYLRKLADLVARQRDGILSASVVCYAERGLIPESDRLLDEMGIVNTQRLMVHFSNIHGLKTQPPACNEKLKILCGGRIVFRREAHPSFNSQDFKGTDILLRGYALYCQRGGEGELRLPRKGQDVEAARELIRELAIDSRIVWVDEMPLSAFYEEMSRADLICDQFGPSFPGMVTMDAYALGRPVMANFRNEIFSKRFPEPLPGFDAKSPEEVADHLMCLERDRGLLAEMGALSRAYAEKYLAPECMARQLLDRLGYCTHEVSG